MRTLLLIFAFLVYCAPSQAQIAGTLPPDTTYALPTDWEAVYLMLISPGREPVTDQADRSRLMGQHIQYQLWLQDTGRAVAAGGLDGLPDSNLIGLTILRADSLGQAQAWAGADPAVAAGHFAAEVAAWYIPAGGLRRP